MSGRHDGLPVSKSNDASGSAKATCRKRTQLMTQSGTGTLIANPGSPHKRFRIIQHYMTPPRAVKGNAI